jgi:hypothetical protein
MTKHLAYSLIGGLLFLGVTMVVLNFWDTGVHEGLLDAISESTVYREVLKASFWIGALTGGISSIALRKSVNQKIYVWIVLIFILLFTEFVIITIV